MNKKIQDELNDDLREEYDLSQLKNSIKGKYYQQYQQGYKVNVHYEDGTTKVKHFESAKTDNVIILDPDVKIYFPNSESVNSTLRSLIELIPNHK